MELQRVEADAYLLSDKQFVKEFVKSTEIIDSIPSYFTDGKITNDSIIESEATSIPVIDYALLLSTNSDDRKKIINEIDKACQDWGFFMLVNHGIEESLTKAMFKVSNEFFELPQEEKLQYKTKHLLDPITCGTSYNNALNHQVFFWRDFLKVFVHPDFHSPSKPETFRDIIKEYTGRIREVAGKLVGGVSESLGLEEDYIKKTLNLEKGLQIFAVNYYPLCPQPESTIGLPPHSDPGLLTLVVENGIGGLEILHHGNWVHVNALPNSIFVNTCDHLEIFSNGKYKSSRHRAVLNNSKTRITLVMGHGPPLDATVSPALPLLEKENTVPAYIAVNYRDYIEQQQLTKYFTSSCLERSKIT